MSRTGPPREDDRRVIWTHPSLRLAFLHREDWPMEASTLSVEDYAVIRRA